MKPLVPKSPQEQRQEVVVVIEDGVMHPDGYEETFVSYAALGDWAAERGLVLRFRMV